MAVQRQRPSEIVSSGASLVMAVMTLVFPFGLWLGMGMNFMLNVQDYWSWVVAVFIILQVRPLENVSAYRGNTDHKDMTSSWFTFAAAVIDLVVYIGYCWYTGTWELPDHLARSIWGGALLAGIADLKLLKVMKGITKAT